MSDVNNRDHFGEEVEEWVREDIAEARYPVLIPEEVIEKS